MSISNVTIEPCSLDYSLKVWVHWHNCTPAGIGWNVSCAKVDSVPDLKPTPVQFTFSICFSWDQFSQNQLPPDQLPWDQFSPDQLATRSALNFHEINSHELNCHQINSHKINCYQINSQFSLDQFSRDQLPPDQLSWDPINCHQINSHKINLPELMWWQLTSWELISWELIPCLLKVVLTGWGLGTDLSQQVTLHKTQGLPFNREIWLFVYGLCCVIKHRGRLLRTISLIHSKTKACVVFCPLSKKAETEGQPYRLSNGGNCSKLGNPSLVGPGSKLRV